LIEEEKRPVRSWLFEKRAKKPDWTRPEGTTVRKHLSHGANHESENEGLREGAQEVVASDRAVTKW
jgi:hypothetical protein